MNYIVVIDFEATCDWNQKIGRHVNQIIEFGAVLVSTHTQQIVNTFHSYCQPSGAMRTLSRYCLNLTKVTQAQVDAAPIFPEVLRSFETWLGQNGLAPIGGSNWIMASDSLSLFYYKRFDFCIYLYNECRLNWITYPSYARNVLTVASFFKCHYLNMPITARMPNGIATMLQHFRMTFEGTRHSAVDDARNLGRIVVRMVQDGHLSNMRANIAIYPENPQPAHHMMPKSCFYIDL